MSGPRANPEGEWLRQWEQSLAKWWDTAIEDPAFVRGVGDALAGRAQLRSSWEQGVERTLDQMHMPSKRDVVRLARIASMLEDRLVDIEEQLADMCCRLDRMEKETLRARIDSAEALIRLEERLSALHEKLDAKPDAKPPARTKRG
jgi:hypothetical protein